MVTETKTLVLLLLLCVLTSVFSQTYDNVTALKRALLINYDRAVVPLKNQSKGMIVNTSFRFYRLITTDAVAGTVTLSGSLLNMWVDERLTWTPEDYGGIRSVELYTGELWKPPLILATLVEATRIWDDDRLLRVRWDGTVLMKYGTAITSDCSFNTRYWPFDKQVCDVGFADTSSTNVKYKFAEPATVLLKQTFSQWEVEKMDNYIDTLLGFSFVVFRLYMKRQSGFYVMSVILPLAGLTFVGSLVFLLPVESGERVGFSVSVMLSLTVFLTLITDDVPKTSDPMSLLGIYIAVSLFISFLTTSVVIFNIHLHYREQNVRIGKIYRAIAKVSFREKNGIGDYDDANGGNDCVQDQKSTEDRPIRWQEVSRGVDRVAYIVSIVCSLTVSTAFLVTVYATSSYDEKPQRV